MGKSHQKKLKNILESYLKVTWTLNRHGIYRNNRWGAETSFNFFVLLHSYLALNSSVPHLQVGESLSPARNFHLHCHIYPHTSPVSNPVVPLFVDKWACLRGGAWPRTFHSDLTHENPGRLTSPLYPTD